MPAALPQAVAAPPAVSTGETRFISAEKLNIRSGPGTTYPVQLSLGRGAEVMVMAESGGWSHVRIKNSGQDNLWASSRFLSSKPNAAAIPARSVPKRTVAAPSSREVAVAKKQIIAQSISAYPGSCPCPFNVDRGGRRCGGRSAWSRAGGYAPLCYESDVTSARLATYFARERGATE
ncbi:SH3 domain-containing protein [Pseudooceanicola sp. C21-150M6]|uniref:SH3 domain-containing protein n=1 Tax=Pseudooceanicola sp. C21-150M6 TaxID=3434355 RepID=UPI003D7F907F